jgi:hypothetical protein
VVQCPDRYAGPTEEDRLGLVHGACCHPSKCEASSENRGHVIDTIMEGVGPRELAKAIGRR